ncbi:D-amino acid dehydrogenase [Bordetella avium]|uniref:D-amino acid dehydrogenase n=1 Tax=Bordetella avium TaxID=521 RepID=UPI000E0B2FB3|nr:D-amino acid dehydrogenase [Bordetella avium]RIQ13776.1 FAD-dependent oxidoreductase [Bordetella avium]RIQ39473.1 FAD-dependent oxidoreductase [Bordetella avium]RIQ44272.1 FAD-dependent oxidoreductase [Bordetella avium]RIQ45510.1 FAD-dependent oxidoreductase [Bordetella avium]RIQ51311.1 FAD-dependent oxidoreductase [Bordetella avium]
MKIIVIGAGIIGMTSAYALAKRGHEVTVVDGQPQAGTATSLANGAQLSYSFVSPLADKGVLQKLPGWLLSADSPLRFRPRLDRAQWRWLWTFIGLCQHSAAERTTRELLQLGALSRRLMHEMVQDHDFSFDFAPSGKLLVYQNIDTYRAAQALARFQASLGCEQHDYTPQQCVDVEPALTDIASRIVGGIFTPTEDAADCHALCTELQHYLSRSLGVTFQFGTRVNRVVLEGSRAIALETSAGSLGADGFVIANGVEAQTLCASVGIDPLIYPLKGYSLTYELTSDSCAPHTSLSDVHNKVVYARLGNRLRVAGMVDIGDRSLAVDRKRIAALKAQVDDYLPRLNAAGIPTEWTGLRPARPDSKPIIGATPYERLWLNVGHGALGFTLAAGSAEVLSDRIEGRRSAISEPLFSLTSSARRRNAIARPLQPS